MKAPSPPDTTSRAKIKLPNDTQHLQRGQEKGKAGKRKPKLKKRIQEVVNKLSANKCPKIIWKRRQLHALMYL
jgi:hypothetical protein